MRTLEADEGCHTLRIALSPDGASALSASHTSPVRLWNLETLSVNESPFKAPLLICRVTNAVEADSIERRYSEILKCAERALAGADYAEALRAVRAARSLPGYDRAKDALSLWHSAGIHSVRKTLKGAWCVRSFHGHSEGIRAVALSRDAHSAVSVSNEYSGTLNIWNVEAETPACVFSGVSFSDAFALSRDTRFLILGGGDTPFKVLEIASKQCLGSFQNDTDSIGAHGRSLAISHDGSRAVSDGLEVVKLWDVATGRCVREFVGHTDLVACVALGVSGKFLVSGGSDNTARLWDVESGVCLHCFEGHSSTVRAVTLSLDEKWILSGSWDGTLRLWNRLTGECVRVLEGHITESAVSLATDNKWALSAGGMWDLSSGRRIWSFGGESGVFTTATLSDNNRWVLLGTKDGKLQLWELDWDYEFLT